MLLHGSYDAFIAAIQNGANAVYLGGKLFNARANATNFDLQELKEIVNYAHLRNVKIHLTLNTLLDNSELKDALSFAYDIYEIGVDAVIVQDLGLAKVLHENIPELPLHASTQLSTHTLEGVQELTNIGFTRVVLARELSIEEIKYICENTNTEIEIFAHGAQCISYSGQCLFSSMVGDRSGNRGKCAQPCRLPYKLLKDSNGKLEKCGSGYLLSPKDLSTLEILNELPNVACLKIEGRMKSPEYVATVIRLYRKYLDSLGSIPTESDKTDLAQIFNRGGFSTAYLKGKTGKDVMCYEKPKNWGIYIGKVLKVIDGSNILVSNDNNVHLINGDGIEIWNGDNECPSSIISYISQDKKGTIIGRISGNIRINDKVYRTSSKELNDNALKSLNQKIQVKKDISVALIINSNEPTKVLFPNFSYDSNIIPEKAINNPLSEEQIKTQFKKSGNTPFNITNIEIAMKDSVFMPVSKLNELRRVSLEAYEDFLNKNNEKIIQKSKLTLPTKITKKPVKKTYVLLNDISNNCFSNDVDGYYINFKDYIKHEEIIKNIKSEKYVVLPNITKGNYERLIKENLKKVVCDFNGVVISNIGQLSYFKDLDKHFKKIANYTMNVFNIETIKLFEQLGFSKIILSTELTKHQINELCDMTSSDEIELEVLAYGNVCVMTSEYCPIGSIVGNFSKNSKCSKPCLKNERYYLNDRMNVNFRVIPDNIDCQSRIYNSKITSIETNELNVDSIRLDFIDETTSEIDNIVDTHKKGKGLSGNEYTRGHFTRFV